MVFLFPKLLRQVFLNLQEFRDAVLRDKIGEFGSMNDLLNGIFISKTFATSFSEPLQECSIMRQDRRIWINE